jgi:hypothetical protein
LCLEGRIKREQKTTERRHHQQPSGAESARQEKKDQSRKASQQPDPQASGHQPATQLPGQRDSLPHTKRLKQPEHDAKLTLPQQHAHQKRQTKRHGLTTPTKWQQQQQQQQRL